MTAIIGFAEHLLHYWDRTADNLRLDQVAAIERQSMRLQRLVEGLLDFSAIEADNLGVQPEEVDLAAAVHAAVSTCRIPDVEVAVPPGVTAWGRPPPGRAGAGEGRRATSFCEEESPL